MNKINTPQLKLPQGGGSVRGADENFSANAFTGTASLNIAIPLPEGRGLSPHLSIGYSSGSGNGLLGMGFHLSESAIEIKTNRALPKYDKDDIYQWGGVELVKEDGENNNYLERHQSSFALIERIIGNGRVHWKVTHNDNSVSIYGNTIESQIFDPAQPTHIYKWLLSEQSDDHGNIIKYNYDKFGGTNSYLTSIEYGNYTIKEVEYFAHKAIVDYGQIDYKIDPNHFVFEANQKDKTERPDILSNYRAGFLVKTEYLIKSILVQHNFVNEPNGKNLFVYCYKFEYESDKTSKLSYLKQVIQYGLKKVEKTENTYSFKKLPPIDLVFSSFPYDQPKPLTFNQISDVKGPINQPLNFFDYNKEGMAGILYRNADTLYYSRPLGNGQFTKESPLKPSGTNSMQMPNQFANPHIPLNLVSLEGNGQLQIELENAQSSGYYPLNDDDNNWNSFVAFPNEQINNIPFRTEHVDISGTNRTDQIIISPEKIYFRPSLGVQGMSTQFVEIENTNSVESENAVFINPYEYYGFADFFGDGLSHRIKLEKQKLHIWPCLGYGNFGEKVIVDIPNFEIENQQIDLRKRLVLADVNGTGTTDLVLLFPDRIQVYFNQNGNSFSDPKEYFLPEEIQYSDFDRVQFHDVVGNGNTCLVFSKLSPHVITDPKTKENSFYDIAHYYCELNPSLLSKSNPCNKAFMLRTINNNMGLINSLTYKSSLTDYFALQNTPNPWLTQLPFPTIVLNTSSIYDALSDSKFTSQYVYRNGYYDPNEHSFVGFGNVWQYDVLDAKKEIKELKNTLHKTWFHLGLGQTKINLQDELYQGDEKSPEIPLHIIEGIDANNPEALFALAGESFHIEVYETDYTGYTISNQCPYHVESNCTKLLVNQAPTVNTKGVFKHYTNESISLNYEQQVDDPHLSQQLVIEVDDYLHVLKATSVVYPRRIPLIDEQGVLLIAASEHILRNQSNSKNRYIGIGLEEKSFEILNAKLTGKNYYSFNEVSEQLNIAFKNQIPYSNTSTKTAARLLSWSKQKYWNKIQTDVWDEEEILDRVLPHHSKSIVFDTQNVQDILGDKKESIDFEKAGYVFENDYWWAKSEVAHFASSALQFYLLQQVSYDWEKDHNNYLYTQSNVKYDAYNLFPISSTVRYNDEVNIETSAVMDYRTLSPWQTIDANGNKAEVLTDELGIVIATATYEKDGIHGDKPLSTFSIEKVEDIGAIVGKPLKYIQDAASFFYYEFPKQLNEVWQPACTVSLARTVYQSKNANDIHQAISYSDGLGRIIETKAFAGEDNQNQWLASGRVTYNAKGEVTASYLSYFSDTWKHVTPSQWASKIKDTLPPPTTFLYDAVGRNYQINTPKGFFSRTLILNAWESQHYDENDTVLESEYYKKYKSDPSQFSPKEIDALEKSIKFYNTPQTQIIDNLGRQILGVSNNKEGNTEPINWKRTRLTKEEIDPTNTNLLVQWQSFDIQGRPLLQADARLNAANEDSEPNEGNKVNTEKHYNFKHVHPIAGGIVRTWSADAGETFSFADAQGNALMSWDAMGNLHETTYDNLHRPLTHMVTKPDVDKTKNTITATVYAESLLNQGKTMADLQDLNMVGKTIEIYDNAGVTKANYFTFDGQVLSSTRIFRTEYKTDANWTEENMANVEKLVEGQSFTTTASFDAAGRPLTQTSPDGSITSWQYGMMGNCIKSTITIYGQTTSQTIVNNSQINQFGQLVKVELSNGVINTHAYDVLTQEIKQIKSFKGDRYLQDQNYWHDPTGLITTMQNNLEKDIYYKNQLINPVNTYTYDALYRLKSATGRIQLRRTQTPLSKDMRETLGQSSVFQSADLQAVGNYTEKYEYDKGNNLTQLQRTGDMQFTKKYSIYKSSNRVEKYQQGDKTTKIEYDAAGQMQNINGIGSQKITWNTIGNIATATIVERGDGSDMDINDMEYYVYDASGIRVRKVTERKDAKGNTLTTDDKRYIGNYRCTTKTNADTRHSLTIGGVQKHDCIVQYSTDASGNITQDGIIYRYQHANHLNSIGLETNHAGDVISYEEYSPFGETVYRYDPVNLDSTKEYRYSAQEKDDSTGLYYYGYRYYAPWLCRWTKPDPAGTIDGFNLYAFVGNEPIGKVDVMGLTKAHADKSPKKVRSRAIKKNKNLGLIKTTKRPRRIALGFQQHKETENFSKKQMDSFLDINIPADGARITTSFNAKVLIPKQLAHDRSITGGPLMSHVNKQEYDNYLAGNSTKKLAGLSSNHRLPDSKVVLAIKNALKDDNRAALEMIYEHHTESKPNGADLTDFINKYKKSSDTILKGHRHVYIKGISDSFKTNEKLTFFGDSRQNSSISDKYLDLRYTVSAAGKKRSLTPHSKRTVDFVSNLTVNKYFKGFEKLSNHRSSF